MWCFRSARICPSCQHRQQMPCRRTGFTVRALAQGSGPRCFTRCKPGSLGPLNQAIGTIPRDIAPNNKPNPARGTQTTSFEGCPRVHLRLAGQCQALARRGACHLRAVFRTVLAGMASFVLFYIQVAQSLQGCPFRRYTQSSGEHLVAPCHQLKLAFRCTRLLAERVWKLEPRSCTYSFCAHLGKVLRSGDCSDVTPTTPLPLEINVNLRTAE